MFGDRSAKPPLAENGLLTPQGRPVTTLVWYLACLLNSCYSRFRSVPQGPLLLSCRAIPKKGSSLVSFETPRTQFVAHTDSKLSGDIPFFSVLEVMLCRPLVPLFCERRVLVDALPKLVRIAKARLSKSVTLFGGSAMPRCRLNCILSHAE